MRVDRKITGGLVKPFRQFYLIGNMSKEFGIAELVDRLGRLTHALQFSNGLNPVQWEALRYFARANKYSRTPGALAEFLGSTKGTVSQTLIALEAKGYVRRSRGLTDRRTVEISLTDNGREVLLGDPIRLVEQVGEDLPAELQQALTDGMSRLVESLNRAQGHPYFGICARCDYCHSANSGSRGEEPCYCGYTNEPLKAEETHQICIDFSPAQ